jgi:hypothetical protein
MTKLFYFADYEILIGGKFKVWGQATLVYPVMDLDSFDPNDLVGRIRQQAAEDHGVDRNEVRIRSLTRL